jgi:hypothetical protein
VTGCASGAASSSSSSLLTPFTDLGTIGVSTSAGRAAPGAPRAVADGASQPLLVLDPGRERPAAEVSAARTTLARVVSELAVVRALAERTVRGGRERTREKLVLVHAGNAPETARRGVDTLLEVRLGEIGLTRAPATRDDAARARVAADPALTLILSGWLRVVRTADGVELLSRAIRYDAETKPWSVWIADGAHEFRAALTAAVEALAVQIVEDVL